MESKQGLSPRRSKEWVRGGCIGKGSFGTVTLAVNKSNGQAFAVKSVTSNSSAPSATASLENEIQILRSLSSPYIVSYLGDDVTQEYPAGTCRNLHMEYVPGGTLAELAARHRPMDEPDVREYTRCLVRALHYLHSVAGVVHGDVKGQNILVDTHTRVAKLVDFGSAKRVADKGVALAGGTPLWMAPEVVRGERQGPESDVWSLGCTVIEIASGRRPWSLCDKEENAAESVLFRIGFGDEVPEYPPCLSAVGGDFLDKCLKRDASQRWTSEQLLQHPFLVEEDARVLTGPSPRSVLDWANIEFGEDEENFDFNAPVSSARERIGELATGGELVSWDSDGWEVVRRISEFGGENAHQRVGEGEGMCLEYSHFLRVDSEDEVGDVSEASGSRLDEGTRCSQCSCCCCDYCCCSCCSCRCCTVVLGCQHGMRRAWGLLFFGCCETLFRLMIVEAYPTVATFVSLYNSQFC